MRRISRLSELTGGRFRKEGYLFSNTTQDTKDIEFHYEEAQIEREYPLWWSFDMLRDNLRSLPENKYWNLLVCAFTLTAVVWAIIELQQLLLLHIAYNAIYALHSVAVAYNIFTQQDSSITIGKIFGMLVDLVSFAHFVNPKPTLKKFCYFIRLHRPFRYLFSVYDFNMNGSVWGTAAKVYYIFMVLRISWAYIWIKVNNDEVSGKQNKNDSESSSDFLVAAYIVDEIFLLIGADEHPTTELARLTYLGVMMSGILMVAGVAVAYMSLTISLYMRSEEVFRSRYRLIIKEMDNSRIPEVQRDTVETFYLMYWKKQRAVSDSELLLTFPPTLLASIYMDIYFEATQKSKVLKDLSAQFLSELANKMKTIHYIPGDAIIKRNSKKNAMIYITYGDVELLTPEDDMTAILRLTKGSVISPCGVAALDGFGYAHLEVRAATYCTAHVLTAETLWKVAVKYGRQTGQTSAILDFFSTHIENVKKHHLAKPATTPEITMHKSSIVSLKRSLIGLKMAKNPDGSLLMSRTDYFLQIAGCYVMRNRADASLTDESDKLCLRPTFPCILQPNTSLTFAWNLFVSALVLIIIFVYPYYMVFTPTVPLGFRSFDIMTSAIYVLDMIVHLSTGDNVEEGVAITFSQTASQQMMSSWFVVDAVATLPIFAFIGTGHYTGINKIFKTGKMFRFLRELEFLFVYNSHMIRFCSYTLLIIIVCYLTAALQQDFMCNYYSSCVVTNLTHGKHWEPGPTREDAVETNIVYSLYWALSMIVFSTHRESGSLDNWKYVIYCLVVMEICMLLMIFMKATYAATIMVTSILRDDYSGCISNVTNFLTRNHVDATLRMRFIQYLHLCWYTDKAYSMTHKTKTIFYDLPPHVYQDIVTKQRSQYIFTVPFLKYLLEDELKNVSSKARLFYTSPHEILLSTGDLVNEIYVIKKGFCEIIDPITKQIVNLIGPKNQFGILVCLLRVPAYYTVRAATHVQVFSISRKSFRDAINKPNIKKTLDHVRRQPEFKSISKRLPPFRHYEPLPKPHNLMRFKLPRKHEPDHAFLQPFFRLGFFSILRYIFPRYTIRPDSTYLMVFECIRVGCAVGIGCLCPCYEYMVLQFPGLWHCAMTMDAITHMDVIQRLLVGYFNEQGVLIYHPASTAAHYIKGAFIVDLLSILPLEVMEPLDEVGNYIEVLMLRNILSLNRLIQLYRLPSAARILKRYVKRQDCIVIFMGVPLFVILVNAVTTFVVLSSVEILFNGDGYTITPLRDKGGSWIHHYQPQFNFNITSSMWNMHLAAFYWIAYEITSTGYNSIEPSNLEMIVVMLVGILAGLMMIMYIMVSIMSVRANVNKALAQFHENMTDMVAYMKKENLDPELRKEVSAYYEYSWDKMGGVDYRHVFKLCAQSTLRTDAILHIYGPTFARCPILQQSDASLLRSLGRDVYNLYFNRGQTIIETNDIIRAIYFVDYGDVNLSVISNGILEVANLKLSRGSIFGNLNNVPCINCPIQVVAASKVHILRMRATSFHEIIDDFPSVKPLMQKYRPTEDACYISSTQMESQKRRNSPMSRPMLVRGLRGRLRVYFRDRYVQIFLILISLSSVVADTYNAGFQDNRPGFVLMLYLLDVAFYLKMVMQFCLPKMVEETVRNVLIPQRNEYLHGEFKIDIISCLPLELFSFISSKDSWLYFSWLRLNRCLRISTAAKSMKRYKEHMSGNMIYGTILIACIWFFLFIHCSACLWYFIGAMEERAKPDSSWFYTGGRPLRRDGALRQKPGGQHPCQHMYICSIYFVFITFTQNGNNDILPRNQSEVLYVILLQIMSTFVFMMYVGELTNVLHYHSFRCFSFYAKYLELQDYFDNNRVSMNLVEQVNRYCQHLWRESRGLQIPKFLTKAPQGLRLKVMSAAYLHHLTRHHVFEDCDPSFLRQLVGCLKVFTYNEGMYVVKCGEITNAMYLIHKGDVEELDLSMPEGAQVTRVYPAGSYFGVFQGLFHNEPYTRTYQTISNSTVLTLFLDDWMYLLAHYPESHDAINAHMHRDRGRKISNVPSAWPEAQKKPGKGADASKSAAAPKPTVMSQIGAMILQKLSNEKKGKTEDVPSPFNGQDTSKPTTKLTDETTQESPAGPSFLRPTKRQDNDDKAFIDSDVKETQVEKTKAASENTNTKGEDEEKKPWSLWPTKRQDSDNKAFATTSDVKQKQEKETKASTESSNNAVQKSKEAGPSSLWPTKQLDSNNKSFDVPGSTQNRPLMLEHKEETENIELIEMDIAHESLEPVTREGSLGPASTQSLTDDFTKIRDVKQTSEKETRTTTESTATAQKPKEAGSTNLWRTKRQDSDNEADAKISDVKQIQKKETKVSIESSNNTVQKLKEAVPWFLWPTKQLDSENKNFDVPDSTQNRSLMSENKEETENIELIEMGIAHESLEPVTREGSLGPASTQTPTEAFGKISDVMQTSEKKTGTSTESTATAQKSKELGPTSLWPIKGQNSDEEAFAKISEVKQTEEKETKTTNESFTNIPHRSKKSSSLLRTKQRDSDNEIFDAPGSTQNRSLMSENKEETENIELIEMGIAHESLEPVTSEGSLGPASTQTPTGAFAKISDVKQTSEKKTGTTKESTATAQKSKELGPTSLLPIKGQNSDEEAFAKISEVKQTEEKETKTTNESFTNIPHRSKKSLSLLRTKQRDSDNEILDAPGSTQNRRLMLEHKEEAENIEFIEMGIAHVSLETVTSKGSLGTASTQTPTKNIEFIEKGVAELSLDNPKSKLIIYPDKEEEREMVSMDISQSQHDTDDDEEKETSLIDIRLNESRTMLPKEAREQTTSTRMRRKSVRLSYEKDDEESDDDTLKRYPTHHNVLVPEDKPDGSDKKDPGK